MDTSVMLLKKHTWILRVVIKIVLLSQQLRELETISVSWNWNLDSLTFEE